MKKILKLLSKKYVWSIVLTIILILSTSFTMLDAFVIPKSYSSAARIKSGNSRTLAQSVVKAAKAQVSANSSGSSGSNVSDSQGSSGQSEASTTDYSYKDDNISINVEKLNENGAVFYVADIQVSDASYLKTALANDTYGKNITQTTSEMASANHAIFAINGDYYGFRDTGLVIRNGVLYRDTGRNSSDNQALTINSKGELGIVTEGEATGESLIKAGIVQGFSFGPVLVKDSQAAVDSSSREAQRTNPRTAIGQISPLHYIVIVVDGRTSESQGMTLDQLAREFVERGATIAYNLDGGGSSTMWLSGKVINNPTDGRYAGERSVSDIIYIGK